MKQLKLTLSLSLQVTKESEIIDYFGCSKNQFQSVLENFCNCLMSSTCKQIRKDKTAVYDHTYGHLWAAGKGHVSVPTGQTCQCKAVECDDTMSFSLVTDMSKLKVKPDVKVTGRKPVICDSFHTGLSSIKSGVAISNMVIGIEQFIQDVN